MTAIVTPRARIGYYGVVSDRIAVYLETTAKRTFASAIDWPGWSRSGKTAELALQALAAAGPRYVRALGPLARTVTPPTDGSEFDIRERVPGGSGTEFGVPSTSPSGDDRPLKPAELERLTGILEAAWAAFDLARVAAKGKRLSTGPRGGGRDLAKMAAHVREADWSYLSEIAGQYKPPNGATDAEIEAAIRAEAIRELANRAKGVPARESKRIRPWWTPRYYVRRAAWHALDHAWELEDRIL